MPRRARRGSVSAARSSRGPRSDARRDRGPGRVDRARCARRHCCRPRARPAPAGARERRVRARADAPLRRPAGSGRGALDAGRRRGRLPARPARRAGGDRQGTAMTARARTGVFLGSAAVLGAFLVWSVAGLPDFGHVHGAAGALLDRVAVRERHASNVVATVVFDYRGVDTLGEELILFAAAMGVALLLRSIRDADARRPPDRVTSDAIRLVGQLVVPIAFLLGLWLAAFGYVTPGGGFQGGV